MTDATTAAAVAPAQWFEDISTQATEQEIDDELMEDEPAQDPNGEIEKLLSTTNLEIYAALFKKEGIDDLVS